MTNSRSIALALVTIGQSPRDDIMAGLGTHLPPGTEVAQAGLLDNLGPSDLVELAPRPGEQVLVTRMRDGGEVRLSEKRTIPRFLELLRRVDRSGADVILVLCTGSLLPPTGRPAGSGFRALLVRPDELLTGVVRSLARGRSLGVIVPSPDQVEPASERWSGAGRAPAVVGASPYGPAGALRTAAASLALKAPELVVMDCMGFGPEHRRVVQEVVECPVILASALVGRVVAELLAQNPE